LRKKKEKNKEEEDALSKARESHLVIAALIATVTFAASFTLPDSYKSDGGIAILAKNSCFYSIYHIRYNVNDALYLCCL
jgi:hypothetical protein